MNKKKWNIIFIVVAVITLLLNVLSSVFSGYMDLYLGKGEAVITQVEGSEDWDTQYSTLDYASSEELKSAAQAVVEETQAEGSVLLKNENNVLPLTNATNVTLFGRGAADPVYGGAGSGSIDVSTAINFKKGLENAGFTVNPDVYSTLEKFAANENNPRANIVMDNPTDSTYYIGEMPVTGYDSVKNSFANYSDAAIVVIGRAGGEGGDLGTSMEGWDDNYVEGQHQLELNKDELDMLALVKENFENVVVIINSNNVMELGVLENDPQIDSILWIGSPGQYGNNAVGKILKGEVNPSGKTADIFPTDLTADPTFVNIGSFQYSNIDESNSYGNGYFVQYEEGIYIGYRYYETAAVEEFINYDEAVVYPFGYGLSYTSFDWSIAGQNLGGVDGQISIDVAVTNTGDVAGKEVVELYYSAPYTDGGIEKSSVVLGAFAKTGLLEPGASETVTLIFDVEDMASYDYETEKAYVLEAGDYQLLVQTDSHSLKEGIEAITYNVGSAVVYSGDNKRSDDEITVTNQFDDVSAMFTDTATEGKATNMSRADFAGTFPTAPTDADKVADEATVEGFKVYDPADYEDSTLETTVTGASNGLSLIDLRGVEYDSDVWDDLVEQMTVEEMMNVLLTGAYNTAEVESIAKPATQDFDGPAGISSFMTETNATGFTSEVVIASTYNVELSRAMGVMVAQEGLELKVSGWYAPAMNTHRNQFAGRNFEYYSEDPLLAGLMAKASVEGAASKGMYAFIKHYALNDQETNRVNGAGMATWANEQAIREIYLKAFEIPVKEATTTLKYYADTSGVLVEKEMRATTALMSSFNRLGSVWAGGSIALMDTVLREEWGFDGAVITDFNLFVYMDPNQGISAGSDLMLTFSPMKSFSDSTSNTAITHMQKAMKNILYAVANSNAMNGLAPGTIITYKAATWETARTILTVLSLIFLIGGAFLVNRKKEEKSKQ